MSVLKKVLKYFSCAHAQYVANSDAMHKKWDIISQASGVNFGESSYTVPPPNPFPERFGNFSPQTKKTKLMRVMRGMMTNNRSVFDDFKGGEDLDTNSFLQF